MSKIRKITVLVASMIFALSLTAGISFTFAKNASADTAPTVDPRDEFDFYLDANDINATDIKDTFETGEFILQGSATEALSVDGNIKSPLDFTYQFERRIKFNGASNRATLDRTISFYLEKKATIKVYALSSSSSDASRTMVLYKNGTDAPVKSNTVAASASSIEPLIYNTTAAGSYYFSADVNGVNVYFIGINYGEAADPVVRGDWSAMENPVLGTPTLSTETDNTINVSYTSNVGDSGADMLYIKMLNAANELVAKKTVLRYGTTGSVAFIAPASGQYHFVCEAIRKDLPDDIKTSTTVCEYDFTLLLAVPTVRARTIENDVLAITVVKVLEADSYKLYYKKSTTTDFTEVLLTNTTTDEIIYNVEGLTVGDTVEFKADAIRTATSETKTSDLTTAILRNAPERDWQFTYFGQSTKEALNWMVRGGNIYDGVQLFSCTSDAAGNTTQKGGKFTYGAMDGISYYYTKIDASEEDFKLKCRVVVDYLNPTPDGQEGFALLVRDSIGINGDATYFYTNSVSCIATKLQYAQGATNKTIKDGIGARFVTGIKDTNATPTAGSFDQRMYPFTNELVASTVNKATDGYIVEVEKKNNCYYTRYYIHNFATNVDELEEEYVLYHDGSIENGKDGKDQLLVVDKENVYVGFAVARGCNATFKDVDFTVTPRSTDSIEIENEKIVGAYAITSPTTTSVPEYTLKFASNADGKLSIKHNGAQLVSDVDVKAYVDYTTLVVLTEQDNTFVATFDPTGTSVEDGFVPGLYQEMDSYEPMVLPDKLVTYKKYGDATNAIVVAPDDVVSNGVIGSAGNLGTKDSPLDLQTAINYVQPGQTILMLEGNYTFGGNLTIERGNNGAIDAYKVLRPDPSCTTRPVIDFQDKGTGIKMWGEYWHLCGFDITRTKYANKGIQLGGKNNILENVNAYYNGDSGVSVSGKSTETKAVWPANNLILNCTSYMNKDQAQEDADGFAAKLYCGEGNVFRGCVAYCNADDGWDLYAKTESGNIGAVTIENCITFGNGFNIDGTSTKGNGNGFKLGGESLSGKHSIANSISFGNKLKGIDSNSCPDDIIKNCTSVYNSTYNFALYSTKATSFVLSDCLSILSGKGDQIAGQNPTLRDATNYLFDKESQTSSNSEGTTVGMDAFTGWTDAKAYFGFVMNLAGGDDSKGIITEGNFELAATKVTTRNADGSLKADCILTLADANATAGAKLTSVPGTAWDNTAITYIGGGAVNGATESGCNKGCKSEMGLTSCLFGFVLAGVAVLLLLKRQKATK